MSALGFVARAARNGIWAILRMVWTVTLGPILALLGRTVATLSCITLGVCLGVVVGTAAVKQWRRYLARKARAAAKMAAAGSSGGGLTLDGSRQLSAMQTTSGGGSGGPSSTSSPHRLTGFHAGMPPPRPIPADVIALALLHLPKWAKEPEVNRMAWFNKVVDYMWPHVDTAVCEAVRAAVEPLMRTAAPPLVSWVGFEKITLGPTPPTLGGVKVHGSNSEEAMIEIEFSWAGGLDVVVAAYVFGVRLPVRIHDLQFRSYIRVTFTPLVDVLPCLGGLEVSLMGLPEHVDFGLTIPPGVDLMALPGAQQAIRFALWKVLGPKMMYPAKLHIPIMANSGVEPESTGMIKVTVVGGHQLSTRRGSVRGGSKVVSSKRSKGFLSSMFKGDRYLVQLFTRKSRVVLLRDKSSDEPTWTDETHYFLTNPDSVLTVILFSRNMKELGRCELPLGQLTAEGRAGKPTRLLLPIEDEAPFIKEPPTPRAAPAERAATPEELEDIDDEHQLLLQKHAVDLATARARCLGKARSARPFAGIPCIAIDLEYVFFSSEGHGSGGEGEDAGGGGGSRGDGQGQGGGGGKGGGSVGQGAGFGEKGPGQPPRERRGILTVFLNRAISINNVGGSKSKPKPAATVSVAGQNYTTTMATERTNKPLWDESFLFFNVSTSERVTVRVTDGDARGEFLGEFGVDVSQVAQNLEMQDTFVLCGVKTNAQVFARLKFTFMS